MTLYTQPAVGEPYVSQCWFHADNLGEKDRAKSMIRRKFREMADEINVEFGPVAWETKKPGDDGVPVPPESLWGEEPRLLVGEAKILIVRQVRSSGLDVVGAEFLSSLSPKELTELRRITKEAAARNGHTITDQDADEIIAVRGPAVAEKALTKGI